jgi:hypothetical protein
MHKLILLSLGHTNYKCKMQLNVIFFSVLHIFVAGGTLGKSKLEQMYSAYASAVISTFDEKLTSRLEVLQQLFNIQDKKAEGIAQKVLMKNLPKMLEGAANGEGGGAMAEMLAAMGAGGLGGAADGGLPGADEEFTPEMLKQTIEQMKELVDSGSVSKEDLDIVRKQYTEMRAAAGAEQLSDEEKQFLKQFEDAIGV